MRRFIACIAFIATVLFAPAIAQANSAGQCSGPSGKTVHSTSAFYKNLQTEGVVPQAGKVFESAGYSRRDGQVSTWLNNDTAVLRLAAPAVIGNYGCRDGKLFSAGRKHIRRNTKVLVSLPKKYGKGDFSPRRTKKFSRRLIVRAKFVGQTSCTNPGKGDVKVIIWIPTKPKKAAKKPAPAQPTPAPVPSTTPPAPEQPREPVNEIPSCQSIKEPQHVLPGMGYEIKFRCSDRDGDSLTIFAEPLYGSLIFKDSVDGVYIYHYDASYPDGSSPLPEMTWEVITVLAMDPRMQAMSPDELERLSIMPMIIDFMVPRNER